MRSALPPLPLSVPSVHSLSKPNLLKVISTRNSSESAFAPCRILPSVEVLILTQMYRADKSDKKVNLSVGAYSTDENKPLVIPVVRKCALEVVQDKTLNYEYLPIVGNANFSKLATELVLGQDCKAVKENRTISVQTLSGTGALRLGLELLCKTMKRFNCLIPDYTYGNHLYLIEAAGFKRIITFSYLNKSKDDLDMNNILCALNAAPEGSVVVLQPSAHNPTGQDPTKEQWKQLSDVIAKRKLFPVFDLAYQGFASGDPDRDVWGIRHFVNEGHETLIMQSFAKIMGLYNARIGNLIVVMKNECHKAEVKSTIERYIQVNYTTPPAFGSRVVERVLADECNRKEWLKALAGMVKRLREMRKGLVCRLKDLKTPGNWDIIAKQTGMFSLLNLTEDQIKELHKKHIYMMKSGRMCMCGLNTKNIDYVANSINEAVKGKP